MRAPWYPIAAAWMLIAAGLSGCGDDAAECRAKAEELGRFLTAMDHDMSPFQLGEDQQLVTRADLPRVAPRLGLGLEVAGSHLRFKGQPVDRARLELVIAQALVARDPSQEVPPRPDLYLAIAPEVPWEVVVSIAEQVSRTGIDTLHFAFARPPATPPPPRTATDDEFDAMMKEDPSERAMHAARLMEKAVSRCDAIGKVFSSFVEVPGEDRAELLLRAIGPGLAECECRADLDALRTGMWRVAGNPRPMSFLPVHLARDGAPLALPASTPWREASQRLAPNAAPRWLTL